LRSRTGDSTRAVSILLGIGMLFLSAMWVIFFLPDVMSLPISEDNYPSTNDEVNEPEVIIPNTTLKKALLDLEEIDCKVIKIINFDLKYVSENITYQELYELAHENKTAFKHTYEETTYLLVKDGNEWFAWKENTP
jgi:hypothetical protein